MLAAGDQLTVVRRQGKVTGTLYNNALFSVQPQILPEVTIRAVSSIPGTVNSYLIRTSNSIFRCDVQNNGSTAPLVNDSLMAQLHSPSVRSIYEHNNHLYAGTYRGFFSIATNRLQKLDEHIIYTMAAINADSLLLGVEGSPGFLVLNTGNNQLRPLTDQPLNAVITKIVPYKNGWLCGSDNALYWVLRLGNGSYSVKLWLKDKSLGRVKDILFEHDTCYIGAEGGLFRFAGGKMAWVYQAKDRETCNAIIPYGANFWIGTYSKGMMLISKQGKVMRRIGYNDGLPGSDVYSLFRYGHLLFAGTEGGLGLFDLANNMMPVSDIPGNTPAALLDQEFNHSAVFYNANNQKLFMGGLDGIAEINLPDINIFNAQPQRVILSYVKKSAGINNPLLDLFAFSRPEITILPNQNYISIKFAHTAQQTDLLWRIKELNADWQKGNADKTLDLFSLPPGRYTLEARYPNVLDNRYWLHKTLTIEPHYYQTWWFRMLMMLVVLALAYLIWRIRMQQVLEAQRLRTVVASDLHDQIGSALTRISMTSEILLMKEAPAKAGLERISQDSKDAISSISDIIWSIDARNDSWADVIQRMREHAVIMLDENATLNLHISSSDDQEPVSQQIRQNLYLIFKEAINNIARHAVNAEVSIQINNDEKCFDLIVSNTIPQADRIRYTGQGLKNMEMRAQRIKAQLDIANNNENFVVQLKYYK
jgi:signal transduction histidine kinase